MIRSILDKKDNLISTPKVQRLAVVLGILILSVFFGAFASPGQMQLLILACAGLAVLMLLINRLEWGVGLLILVSFFGKFELSTGTKVPLNMTLVLLIGLVGLWLLHMVVIERDVRLVPSRVTLPAIAFIVAATTSLVAGENKWVLLATGRANLSAQIVGLLLYVLSIGLMLFVGNRIRDLRMLMILTWIFLGIGGLYQFLQLFPFLSMVRAALYVPPNSIGSMFFLWITVLAFGQFLANRELDKKWRLALFLLVLVTMYINWLNREWVSGWLPCLVGILVILWLYSYRWGMLVSVLAVFSFLIFKGFLSSQVMTGTQIYSISSREATWPIMFELIKASPILGLGPANYYYYTPLYSILGWHVNFNSHNNYVDIVAQFGLVGLAIFAWLAVEIGWLGWDLRKRTTGGFSRGYIYAVMGGLAGMLVSGVLADWFLPFLYNIGLAGFRSSILPWLFFGGLIAIEKILGPVIDNSLT